MEPKILVVLTSQREIQRSEGKPARLTGWSLFEFAHFFDVLVSKVTFITASPKGGTAPLDPFTIIRHDVSSTNFFDMKWWWHDTANISDFLGRADEFDAIFYPGGHGPMFDIAIDKDSIALIAEFWAKGKVIAAVSHGSAALVNVTLPNGESLLKDKDVTGFSNAEEEADGIAKYMPFMLEDKIIANGANYHKASVLWAPTVCVSGQLITGQNPASARGVGEAVVEALGTSN
ncbi:hypothetical protein M426DRAFT_242150 [Hypoxylon sp. CI-4A]|nr:hypothetical protein M426DRAFT_242150 [Hypoxylon sp. CI-4A]